MDSWVHYFDTLEIDVCLRINRLARSKWVRQFFALVSKLGDGWIWGLLGIGLLYIRGVVVLPTILVMLLTAIAGIAIYTTLKQNLVRERPYISHRGILPGTAPLDRYSFPSGHTLHASSFATMTYFLEPALFVIVLPIAVLIALSRTILGLHYPSDVLAGAVIGALLGSAGSFLALSL